MKSQKKKARHYGLLRRLDRRNFIKGTGFATLAGITGCSKGGNGVTDRSQLTNVPTYESIGIRPIINCWGTVTMLSGSLMLPKVKLAMEEAGKYYVPIEELMECVGRRLGELSGAEWGIVTSGAAAAIYAATAACVAGADPEKKELLPDTRGMKNEAIIPSRHFTGYHVAACKMVGVKLIKVDTREEMEAAVNEKTSIIYLLGTASERGNISLEDIVAISKKHGVPTMVDAAAEGPNVPNIYLDAGCDLVCYSGGKFLRGPQASGLLLGRKDLAKAAFLHISPHGGIGRPMKVGKEEIMGVLAALELWVNDRDHEAEWKEWERRLDYISKKITQIPSVTTKVNQPTARADFNPNLLINWDQDTVKLTPREVFTQLLEGDPRIVVPGGTTVAPHMMEPGEEIIVAQRIYDVLSSAT
jgi:D-glucosaminate-6-phosphate ammonia-lyase